MLTRILAVCGALTLSACAYWPPEGHGGQAESFETAPSYRDDLRSVNLEQIECFDRLLQSLSTGPVRLQHPAKLSELSVAWTRALRAHAGNLDQEAQDDLVILGQKLKQFQKTLKRESHFQLVSTASVNEETCQ